MNRKRGADLRNHGSKGSSRFNIFAHETILLHAYSRCFGVQWSRMFAILPSIMQHPSLTSAVFQVSPNYTKVVKGEGMPYKSGAEKADASRNPDRFLVSSLNNGWPVRRLFQPSRIPWGRCVLNLLVVDQDKNKSRGCHLETSWNYRVYVNIDIPSGKRLHSELEHHHPKVR